MTTLSLAVDRSSNVPLHRQIYDGIRGAILDGLLSPGRRVPSTRSLAVDLAVSRLPVLAAYDQLLHEGYLEGRVGSGTYVSAALPDDLLRPHPARDAGARPRTGRARRHPRPPPRPRDFGGLGPFRVSLPALDQFPHAAWARLVARHAHSMTHAEMAYGDPAGLVPLRVAIADHLRLARGVRCEAEQVFIVSGSQAALRLAATVLLGRGDRVAMEDPGYPGARAALVGIGSELAPVPVDEDGISVAALRQCGRRVRAVYVTPSHQYPLGMTMKRVAPPAPPRLGAPLRPAWVVEDDYDSEYRYESQPVAALQGLDPRRARRLHRHLQQGPLPRPARRLRRRAIVPLATIRRCPAGARSLFADAVSARPRGVPA